LVSPAYDDDLLKWFRAGLLIRRFEEAVLRLSEAGDVRGHFHLYIGQENTGVPIISQLGSKDLIFTTHRNHGHLLARGADPRRVLAEIMGRASGYNRGRGGTLHIACRDLGVPSTSAIVGGSLPLATGAAYAARRLGGGRVVVCLFGDGALEEGAFYEAVNMAALWRLPVIYICENNSLGATGQEVGEYPSSTNAASELSELAAAFTVPAESVDGTDVNEVSATFKRALERARRDDGPTFIEARTVRWPGSRPLWPRLLTGRTDLRMAWDPTLIGNEYKDWFETNDGILKLARQLVDGDVIDSEGLLSIDRGVETIIEEAIAFAKESPLPTPNDAVKGVFS